MANPIKTKAKVVDVTHHGNRVYSVRMEPYSKIPRIRPGQFLHLTVDDFDPTGGFWPESRVFSIASAPGAPVLEIIYSVKGRYTEKMETVLAVGREIWLKLPYGSFIIDSENNEGSSVVLIAGGTGISPFLPFLEQLRPENSVQKNVRLYYGVRNETLIMARPLLEFCSSNGLLEANLFIEDDGPKSSNQQGISLRRGRLDIEYIHSECVNLPQPTYYISGPPVMIDVFKESLAAYGVDQKRIKIDEWE